MNENVLSVEEYDRLIGELDGSDQWLDVVMEELGLAYQDMEVYGELAERGFSECSGCGVWAYLNDDNECETCFFSPASIESSIVEIAHSEKLLQ